MIEQQPNWCLAPQSVADYITGLAKFGHKGENAVIVYRGSPSVAVARAHHSFINGNLENGIVLRKYLRFPYWSGFADLVDTETGKTEASTVIFLCSRISESLFKNQLRQAVAAVNVDLVACESPHLIPELPEPLVRNSQLSVVS